MRLLRVYFMLALHRTREIAEHIPSINQSRSRLPTLLTHDDFKPHPLEHGASASRNQPQHDDAAHAGKMAGMGSGTGPGQVSSVGDEGVT